MSQILPSTNQGDEAAPPQRFLNEEIPRLFINQGVYLEVLSASPHNFQLQAIEAHDVLKQHLSAIKDNENRRFDLVCDPRLVRKDFSWGHIQSTSDSFVQLLDSEKVFQPYNDLVRRFASRIKGDNNMRLIFHTSLSTSLTLEGQESVRGELCYNVHHVEKNRRNRGSPWSLRETGIYHQINLVTKRSSWIFIELSSTTRNKVIGALKDDFPRENPMLLHLDILFAMAMNWPAYIEYLSYKLDELDDKACFSKVGEKIGHDYAVTFSDCQRLHLLRTKLSTCLNALQSCREAAEEIETRFQAIQEYGIGLSSGKKLFERIQKYYKQIAAYCRSVEAILQRSSGTSALLTRILAFADTDILVATSNGIRDNVVSLQEIALRSHEESRIMGRIAQQTQKDSMTLKALTIIATVYLPATLIATVFSSSLIQLESDSSFGSSYHYIVAKEFWVFVLATLTLMIVTIASFLLLQHRWSRSFI